MLIITTLGPSGDHMVTMTILQHQSWDPVAVLLPLGQVSQLRTGNKLNIGPSGLELDRGARAWIARVVRPEKYFTFPVVCCRPTARGQCFDQADLSVAVLQLWNTSYIPTESYRIHIGTPYCRILVGILCSTGSELSYCYETNNYLIIIYHSWHMCLLASE